MHFDLDLPTLTVFDPYSVRALGFQSCVPDFGKTILLSSHEN